MRKPTWAIAMGWAKRVLPVLLALLLFATPSFGQSGRGPGNAPLSGNVVDLTPGAVIPGQYIIVLHDTVADPAAVADELARTHGLGLGHVYSHALKGFSARVPAGRLNALSRDPRVQFIEADQTARTFAQTIPTGIRRIFAPSNANIDIDGLDDWRIDVGVAVIDTGIDSHPDLNVSSSRNTDCTSGACVNGSAPDGYGHGTHVSGTIGALDNDFGVVGVAPGVRLWGVKVLSDSGSGSYSWVIAGVDWVTARASQIKVANMSLGGGSSSALCLAVANSVAAGVTHVVAAGNSNADAANYSPANCPAAIAVSALADADGLAGGVGGSACGYADDTLAGFSNWSATVPLIAAPGVCILSTYKGGVYATMSGTSMASPHVTGAAALLAADVSARYTTPALIRTALNDNGNLNWTDNSGDGVQEKLLDVHSVSAFNPRKIAGSGGSSDTTPPTVGVSAPTAEATVSGTIPVQITASDAGTPAGNLVVTWKVDGGTARSTVYNGGTGKYEASWDTTTASNAGHNLTATALDLANNTATSPAVNVTVNNGPPTNATGVSLKNDVVVCTLSGGKQKNQNLAVSLTFEDNLGALVAGAAVSVSISRNLGGVWNGTGTTGTNGTVTFSISRAAAGIYTTHINSVAAPLPWDTFQPKNTCTK